MWKFLRHPNVLPLIGVMMSETQLAIVSQWMMNGSINEYAKAHPDVNRLELVSLPFKPYFSSSSNSPGTLSLQVPLRG